MEQHAVAIDGTTIRLDQVKVGQYGLTLQQRRQSKQSKSKSESRSGCENGGSSDDKGEPTAVGHIPFERLQYVSPTETVHSVE